MMTSTQLPNSALGANGGRGREGGGQEGGGLGGGESVAERSQRTLNHSVH